MITLTPDQIQRGRIHLYITTKYSPNTSNSVVLVVTAFTLLAVTIGHDIYA